MLQNLLLMEEGKTLEFKENTTSLSGIIKTVVAFANTAGGTIVVGVEDRTKKLVGLAEPLEDEMRIINKISDSITPFISPNIDIQTYRNQTLILIHVPYAIGPYYLKRGDGDEVAYVRFGSTNRIADAETIAAIKSLARNVTFDEIPCPQTTINDLDWDGINTCFEAAGKPITKNKAASIGIVTTFSGSDHPSNGGILLFGKDRARIFPDAIIRCVRFAGHTKEKSSDHREIEKHLPDAIDEVLHFITKNTLLKTEIGLKKRVEHPQYPIVAIREAITNAIVHTDYAIKGSSIIVAIYDDRLEITNPGGVPYGLTLEDALAGSSRARNRVIARTFHVLKLIEQWGSGLQKIIQACIKHGLQEPRFEEIGSQFRVTLYAAPAKEVLVEEWQENLLKHMRAHGELSTSDAAQIWNIDVRSARRRLTKLVKDGVIAKIGTSKHDPHSKYIARNK